MTDVLLAIGTAKGLVLARSTDRGPGHFVRSAVPDERRSTPSRSTPARRRPAAAGLGDSSHWGPPYCTATTSARPGPSRTRARSRSRPTPRRRSCAPGARVPSADRAGRGLGGQPAERAVPLRGPRRALQPGPAALGPPAPTEWGRASAARRSTPCCRTRPIRAASGGDVERRRLPLGGRRRVMVAVATPASGRTSCPTRARVRPVRPQDRPRLRRPGPALPAEPPRRLPQRRRRATWQSIAEGLPADFGFADGRPPAPARRRLHLPDHGRRRAVPARARLPRVPHRGRRQRVDAADRRAAAADYYDSVLRDAMCADDADPAGVYFGTRNGEVYASADEGEHWGSWSRAPARRAVRRAAGGVNATSCCPVRCAARRRRAHRRRRRLPDGATVAEVLDELAAGARRWPGGSATSRASCAATSTSTSTATTPALTAGWARRCRPAPRC